MNTTVLMSSAQYFRTDEQINPYYTDEKINVKAAVHEHTQLAATLRSAGITVLSCDAPPTSQDGVYTANWGLVRGKKAVLARLPNARKAEEIWAEHVLSDLSIEVIRVPEKWRFSGQGDALPCGNFLFCGQGYRSDPRAISFAAEQLEYIPVQLQTVPLLDSDGQPVTNAASGWPDSFYYDIDLALAVIKTPAGTNKGLVAYCPEAFTKESTEKLLALSGEIDFITVSEPEAVTAFACNLVSTGSTVVMSANAPTLQHELESRGLEVLTPEVVELAKGGGFIRCQTLSFNE